MGQNPNFARNSSQNSIYNNAYRWSDGLFGLNLVLLSIFSTLWHAANYNKEHYLDLWAMDHAILYLIFRFIAVGLGEHWKNSENNDKINKMSTTIAPIGLFCFYGVSFLVIALSGYLQQVRKPTGQGIFDQGFSPSGRRRLVKTTVVVSDKGGTTRRSRGMPRNSKSEGEPRRVVVPDIGVGGMCLYGGLPVLYMALPVSIMYVFRAGGSHVAMRWSATTLSVAWAYRMLERFCVDGHGK